MRTWLVLGGFMLAACDLFDIEGKVAKDAVEQYGMVKRSGSPMELCVQAQTVAAAFLQAKNDPQYKTWTATAKADCSRAGLPQ